MKIVHIAPNATYNEGWGYQENLLPKYHAKMGHDVTLIVGNRTHSDGKIVQTESVSYFSPDGFRVIRQKILVPPIPKIGSLFSKIDVFDLLVELKPDFVFFHGLVSSTIFQVTKYKRHVNPKMIIVQDNHQDYNIGYGRKLSLIEKLIRFKYRVVYSLNDKYISKVYGVTPWRETYAKDYFKVPSNKSDVLIMGADDEKIHFMQRSEIRNTIRSQYGIKANDFLIVTGGKIDARKKIEVLMRSVQNLLNVKLLVFGQIAESVKLKFNTIMMESNNIIYAGWIDADKVYDYFFAADLVFFPGQHSVLWEQACASKVPCIFQKWEGMDHVNNGGNADFISPVSEETLRDKIKELKFTPKYFSMKAVAESEKTDIYLYSKIAEKSLECAQGIIV